MFVLRHVEAITGIKNRRRYLGTIIRSRWQRGAIGTLLFRNLNGNEVLMTFFLIYRCILSLSILVVKFTSLTSTAFRGTSARNWDRCFLFLNFLSPEYSTGYDWVLILALIMVEYWLRHCIYLNPDYDLVYAWALTTGLGMLESSLRAWVCLSPHYGHGYAWAFTTGLDMPESSLRAWVCLSPHDDLGYAWVLSTEQ